MDQNHKITISPGAALSQVSPERINQQRFEQNVLPANDAVSIVRESSVHDKVAKFDSLAAQGKALERKTADAALKRAMLGREQAEDEMRRYRDEARAFRKQVEEGKDRERKVGERLESVMESYGRAKETHAHTQSLWEKEIRRARKEAFKSQSVVVKLQEELKATRNALRAVQSQVDEGKERSNKREQEAFTARYQLVSVQEELTNTVERIKLVEQERDALKTIAKNEEIARIAAEGQIPLPPSGSDDEFSSPRKANKPLPTVTMPSSTASEDELAQVRTALEWERHRADRAYELMEYMQIECQFRYCSCRAAGSGILELAHGKALEISKPENDLFSVQYSTEDPKEDVETNTASHQNNSCQSPISSKDISSSLAQNIFDPAGVFCSDKSEPKEAPWTSLDKEAHTPQIQTLERPTVYSIGVPFYSSGHGRTPSCEPPSIAMVPEVNTSLLSLLDNYHNAPEPDRANIIQQGESPKSDCGDLKSNNLSDEHDHSTSYYTSEENHETAQTSVFRTISTTTKVPLTNPPDLSPPTAPRPPLGRISPTMTREEALAQIRERRGRARSFAQGTRTPQKQMITGAGERRDCSAPAARSASGGMKSKNGVTLR